MIEVICLATAIWFECRGCPDVIDREAVAHVIMNRRNDSDGEFRRYNTTCDVISQTGHFPWFGDEPSFYNDVDIASWNHVYKIAETVYNGETIDPTNGSLWFHTPNLNLSWTNGKLPVEVGSNAHIFWRLDE